MFIAHQRLDLRWWGKFQNQSLLMAVAEEDDRLLRSIFWRRWRPRWPAMTGRDRESPGCGVGDDFWLTVLSPRSKHSTARTWRDDCRWAWTWLIPGRDSTWQTVQEKLTLCLILPLTDRSIQEGSGQSAMAEIQQQQQQNLHNRGCNEEDHRCNVYDFTFCCSVVVVVVFQLNRLRRDRPIIHLPTMPHSCSFFGRVWLCPWRFPLRA